ncbi:MAG: hypothetical protein JJU00_09830 [Opitutales bacterium]|nr:hypothetical protein [Opitutales bacterium]
MNIRKLLSILLGIAVLSGTSAFAQGLRPGQDENVAILRADLANLQAELAEARRDLVASLEDASEAERRAALAQFRADNAGLIAEIQDLSSDLRDAVREYRPGRPDVPAVPGEVLAARRELASLRAELAQSRSAVLRELGEDATREEIAEALAVWRRENAEEIEKADALQARIDAWFAENRPVRRGPPAEVDPELAERRNAFRDRAQAMRQDRALLREEMRHAESVEERQQLIEDFRAEQRKLMEERREIRRQERINRAPGGERRPGG